MFTGIVEGTGVVRTRSRFGLEIEAPKRLSNLSTGASLAVDGTCLTVVSRAGSRLRFHVVAETRRRTTLGTLSAGTRVNLERPMKSGARFDGHFVLGHVDGIGRVREILGNRRRKSVRISFPKKLGRYFVEKGSVSVNGASLTLGKVGKDSFWIHLIPHTLKATNLGRLDVDSKVNLEADILAKLLLKKR